MRRKITAFLAALVIGITAAFIFAEQKKILCAAAVTIAAVFCAETMRRAELFSAADMRRLVLCFAAGAISLMAAFQYYPSDKDWEDKENFKLKGIVVNAETGREHADFVIKSGSSRIICKYYFSEGFGDNRKISESKRSAAADIMPGDIIDVSGRLKIPDRRRNPGLFDYRLYLKSRRIQYVCSVASFRKVGTSSGYLWQLRRSLALEKCRFLENFNKDEGARGFIQGVVFGDTSLLDESTYREFRENTTAHILAVSGLHVGFILALLKSLSRGNRMVFSAVITGCIVLLYGELTCWNVSTVRSVIAAMIGMFSVYFRRPFDLLSAVSFAGMSMLFYNPYLLFAASFQMSFLAVIGIAFLTKPLSYFIGEGAGALFAVQIAMIPYTAFSFNTVNLAGVFINIPVVFAVSVLVPVSIITFAAGAALSAYPNILISVITGLSDAVTGMNHQLNFKGEMSNDICSGQVFILIGIYILIAFMSSELVRVWLIRGEKKKILSGAVLVVVMAAAVGIPFANTFIRDEIIFVDVGQGDCIHVRCGLLPWNRRNIMFDGGGSRDINIGERTLKPYFLHNGVDHLDSIILSHLHMDHYKGAEELCSVFPVAGTGLSQLYSGGAADEKKVHMPFYLSLGDSIMFSDDVKAAVIWPADDSARDEILDDANERNMVVMMEYRGVRTMLTGDLLKEDEKKMIEYYKERDGSCRALKCDILKVGHHGSRSSSSPEFIKAAGPRIAVIQVGKNNMYGHPHADTIRTLRDNGVEIYRNDRDGAVGINIGRNGSIKVHKML